jgi:hypothetical protein
MSTANFSSNYAFQQIAEGVTISSIDTAVVRAPQAERAESRPVVHGVRGARRAARTRPTKSERLAAEWVL